MPDASPPEATDARQLRTREALYSAFLKLLERKNLDQISVREIAAVAQVGHATFYRHYPSKEALLNDLAAEEIHRVVNLAFPVMGSDSTEAACNALCGHVLEYRKLWRTLLTGGAASVVKAELLAISRGIAAEMNTDPRRPEISELKIILSVNSILETLAWWLRQKKPLPPEPVAHILEQIIYSLDDLAPYHADAVDD